MYLARARVITRATAAARPEAGTGTEPESELKPGAEQKLVTCPGQSQGQSQG
jgi:hypothetical protein